MEFPGGVSIDPVSSAEDLEAFIRLPWEIYAADPLWAPPIISHQRDFLDKNKGPFFEVGEAQCFLARRGGRVVGRISAQINHAYEKHHDNATGFFGFFECVDDTAVSRPLFDTAGQWVRERGKTKLHGPMSFAVYDEVGLLVDGFDTAPVVLHTHNPAYYENLVLDYGFVKTFDWYAYRIMRPEIPDADIVKYKAMLDLLCRKNNIAVTPIKRSEFATRGAQVCELFNQAWSRNWGHVPLSKAQFDAFFTQLAPILRHGLVNVLYDAGEMVGFVVSMPDINLIIKDFNGSFSLFNQLRLLWGTRVRYPAGFRVLILGVKQTHQWKRLHHILMLHTIINLHQNYPKSEWADCSLIPESLTNWIKALESYNIKRYKTFRLYDLDL
ncbi:MAG: hypothetical protein HQK81_11100 [Desulfovibrionaceae bacterium]|nr:hypothetical protein [Desulfovibrionaceae bacterium]MBF0514589.1 hypothetical protein [Desulfovibrionaceae bacterium]